jgi:DNA-binding transcriptional ArsR family regulator
VVDKSANIWKALVDPVRRELLDLLRDGPKTTGTLAKHFEQSRFGVMKHLSVLEDADLILIEKRGRERWNYLNAAKLTQSTERWLSPFQKIWTDRLAGLNRHLTLENDMKNERAVTCLDIVQETELPAQKARIFRALTQDIDAWWGDNFRQAGADSTIRLETRIGADMVETGADQHEVIWARVEEVRAPDILYLSGRFAVVGAVAGRIHFNLEATASGNTKLRLQHAAVGMIATEMQSRFSQGWHQLLDVQLRTYLEKL